MFSIAYLLNSLTCSSVGRDDCHLGQMLGELAMVLWSSRSIQWTERALNKCELSVLCP